MDKAKPTMNIEDKNWLENIMFGSVSKLYDKAYQDGHDDTVKIYEAVIDQLKDEIDRLEKELAQYRAATRHAFNNPESGSRFCNICGKYLTDEIHIRSQE